jgi:hypothetical protein
MQRGPEILRDSMQVAPRPRPFRGLPLCEDIFWKNEGLAPVKSSCDFCGFLFHGPKRAHVQVTPESPVLTVFP